MSHVLEITEVYTSYSRHDVLPAVAVEHERRVMIPFSAITAIEERADQPVLVVTKAREYEIRESYDKVRSSILSVGRLS